ncbi:hypothetical protein Tco_0901814 [Tanacetum coccineum]
MTDLKFAHTHNLVAFLEKPTKIAGFEEIVDFLNATPINYALTVNPTIYTSCIEQFWSTVKAKTVNGEVQLQALMDRKKIVITESTIRRDLQLEDAKDTDFGDMSNHKRIYVTPSHTKKIFGNMKREGKGFSGRVTPLFPTMMVQAQEEMGEGSANPIDPYHTPIITQPSTSQPQKKQRPRKPMRKDTEVPRPSGLTTNIADEDVNEENVSKHSNDPLLSGEDSLKLEELMALRVKRLEKKKRSRTHGLRRLYKVGLSRRVESFVEASLGDQEDASKQGMIADIDADAGITLASTYFDTNIDMFGVHDLDGDEVFVEKKVLVKEVSVVEKVTIAATTVGAATITKVDITLAQSLTDLKSAKPKATKTTVATTVTPASTRPRAKGIVFHNQEQASIPTPIVSSPQPSQGKKEANTVLIEEWDDIQAKIDADHQLAEQLQAQEQEELTDAEKATLFVQLLEKRRKYFAAKRAEEKRNRPPTKAQKRSIMSTYLKILAGYKHNQLKNKSFDDIQKLFDKEMKRVNTFVDMETELVEGTEKKEGSKKAEAEVIEGSSKRAGDELEQENEKKQKVDDDKEIAKLQSLMKIVPDEEEVAIDAIPLDTKPPTIVDYKIIKEGKISFFQIIRADGSSKRYSSFIQMLKSFDREDLETL